jgi:hypothetical protein
MTVGMVLQSWWVAVGTAVVGTAMFAAEWLWAARSKRTPSVADAPTSPHWPEPARPVRDATTLLARTALEAALFVGLALLLRQVIDPAAFAAVAGGSIASGSMRAWSSRRGHATRQSLAGL